MYSLVLMMALSDGAALPSVLPNQPAITKRAGAQELNRGRHGGCRGCYGCFGGCYGCYGGYGGCYGGGYGGGYRAHYFGGAPAGYQSGYGPGAFGPGAYGTGGYQSNYGDPNAVPQQAQAAAPAQIVVELPPDARLSVDDTPTQQTSAQRVFLTPALEPGYQYQYTLTATAVRNGQTVTTTKQVQVRAGAVSRIQLNFNTSEVAQR